MDTYLRDKSRRPGLLIVSNPIGIMDVRKVSNMEATLAVSSAV